MSFSNIKAVEPYHEVNENTYNNPKRNCPKTMSSNALSRHLHITDITRTVISYCIIRAFLDFKSIASFSKSSPFGQNIVHETMNQWRSEGLKLKAKQIQCLNRYSKKQAQQQKLQSDQIFINKIKDASHLILPKGCLHTCRFTSIETMDLIRPCSNLQSLNLNGHEIDTNLLNCISLSCLTLRHINLNLSSTKSDEWQIQFQELLQKCTFLHTVKLRRCGITDETLLVLSKCPHVTHLDLSLNHKMSHIALKYMLESLTGLKTLNFKYNNYLGGPWIRERKECEKIESSFFEMLTEPFPNLRTLNISMIRLNKKIADHIPKIFPNLTALNIRSTILNCEDICSIIKQTPSLTDIDYSCNICEEGEEQQVFMTLIQHCPNLRKINLLHDSLTDHSICFLAKACPNLTEINSSISRETQMGLLTLAREVRFLKYFAVKGVSSLNDNILPQFVELAQNLIKIKLDVCYSEILENKLLSINPNLTVICTDVKWAPVKIVVHNS